jgi:hypothetical protein
MKRDWELIRKILLLIEDSPYLDNAKALSRPEIEIEQYNQSEIDYQINLLLQAGLLEQLTIIKSNKSFRGLTWKGHNFLDLIKSNAVWEEATIIINDIECKTYALLRDILKRLHQEKELKIFQERPYSKA